MTLWIDEDFGAFGAVEHEVADTRCGFPGEGVAQSGTPASLDADAQTAFRKSVFRSHLPDQLCGVFRDFQHVLGPKPEVVAMSPPKLRPEQSYFSISRYSDQ